MNTPEKLLERTQQSQGNRKEGERGGGAYVVAPMFCTAMASTVALKPHLPNALCRHHVGKKAEIGFSQASDTNVLIARDDPVGKESTKRYLAKLLVGGLAGQLAEA